MATKLRTISRWGCSVPPVPGFAINIFMEPPGAKTPWLLLRQYAEVPEKGRGLFQGSLAERNARLRDFRNYVRQGRAYWDAGTLVVGSAAALLFYYSFLNLAKAELLIQPVNRISGTTVGHGLSYNPRGTDSIRSDYLTIKPGVFQYLVEARAGLQLAPGTKLPVVNLLSQIPEIGLEMSEFGTSRPRTIAGLCAGATSSDEAWCLLALLNCPDLGAGEPLHVLIRKHFDPIDQDEFKNWRDVFAMSKRVAPGGNLQIVQSKRTFSYVDSEGQQRPAYWQALHHVRECLGSHVSDPIGQNCDFLLSYSLKKSEKFVLPLALARYAAMFYLSSLVRYKPSALDPVRQGGQAWLMDSFVREVPLNLLGSALSGITGRPLVFEPNGFRT